MESGVNLHSSADIAASTSSAKDNFLGFRDNMGSTRKNGSDQQDQNGLPKDHNFVVGFSDLPSQIHRKAIKQG